MPSLSDTLAHLHQQSLQIVEFANTNYRPSGPFTSAVLGSHDILALIRDADGSEARLFRFVGEENSGNKRVEKRDGGVVTPLKDLKRVGGQEKDNTSAVLRTAMTLVDDYRPMPRARNHIQDLINAHQAQSERVAELERMIEEATSGTVPNNNNVAPVKPTRSIDEAIKAETRAIKRLESLVAAHRPAPSAPAWTTANEQLNQPPRSPSPTKIQPAATRTPAKTPLSARTPNNIHIANSLVNGTTPRRVQQPFNRFSSPLKLLGTPRTGPRSADGRAAFDDEEDDDDQPRTIFSRGRIPSSLRRSVNKGSPEKVGQTDANETVRYESTEIAESPIKSTLPEEAPTPVLAASPVKPSDEALPEAEDTTQASPIEVPTTPSPPNDGKKRVEGVIVESGLVAKSTAKIYTMWNEILKQGLRTTELEVSNDPEAIVKHLYKVSRSDPEPGPADTTSLASVSSEPARQGPPLVAQTILLAHLLLMILRTDDGLVPMQTAKEALGALARARGWNGDEDYINKTIYAGVGKRVLKIDRKGGGGGKLCFAA